MKELILIRHGKSSWEYSAADKDRPLLERGINDGHLVATAFNATSPQIDAVFSSPANRALHTCMIILRGLHYPLDKCTITNALYDFSGESVMTFVLGLDDALNTVLIFGHNHAFTEVANRWGSEGISNVPTTGLVHLRFDTDSWSNIDRGTTVKTIFPKHLK
ncbi:MAG: histidine phosphatase family protein [Flavobacteriaceae bacterium]